jgi:hypothetical protein
MEEPLPLWRRTGVRIGAVAIAIPVLAVAWYLGSPLFLDETVIEEFPVAAPAESDVGTASVPAAATSDGDAIDTAVDDDADPSEEDMTDDASEATAAPEPPPTSSGAVEAGPIALFDGEFRDADASHRGSGTATIYELEDGSRVLRFENLDVTNGPDLHVILSPTGSVENRDDVMTAGYVDLGGLKGNKGDQNYEIPADFDLSGDVTVTIYCQPFHVVFSTASLAASE